MNMTTISVADTARELWIAYRGAQHVRFVANVHFNEARESIVNDLDITTPAEYEEHQVNLQQAEATYETAQTALKEFYSKSYGENGATVLAEFFAAETQRANTQFDHAHHVAYGQTELLSSSSQVAHQGYAEQTSARILVDQARLDTAQLALDALTGVRVN